MKRLVAMLLAASALSGAFAMDFGLSVGLSPRLTQDGFSFSGGLTPWLSAMPAGPESELYFSALVSIDYGDEAWTYSIEPQRFDVLFRPAPGTSIRVGRQAWSDSAGLVASGFFDGFTAQTLWGRARISLASLYTGLMLKGSSNVLMSNADLADRDDGSVGFAPARSVMALTMSVPGAVSFFADTIAQFDARGAGALNSQYLGLGLRADLGPALSLELSGVNALVEPEDSDPAYSLALKAGLSWLIQGGPADRLYIDLRYASGRQGILSPYLSVSMLPPGRVFTARLAGLASVKGGYSVRLAERLSFDLHAALFARSADGGPADSGLDPSSDSTWLGSEYFASLRWAPLSDLNLFAASGFFLPGKAYLKDEPVRWSAALSVIVSM